MKILTWNCGGGFRNKIHLLQDIDADVYIIQECEHSVLAQNIYQSWMPRYLWKGENKNKGLAVFVKESITLTPLDWDDQGLELFLPIKINNLHLLAVWTKHANSPTFQYIGQLWKYLQLHGEKLAYAPSMICGDWNSNARWDVWDRWWNHSDVVKILEAWNMVSVYHQIQNETQGEETQPTFYMQRNLYKPYHIDYLFSSRELFDKSCSKVNIFDKTHWLHYSDHLPILFELNNE